MATYLKGKNARKPHTIRYYSEGRQRERSFRTKREAENFKAEFEFKHREGTFVDPRVASEKFSIVAARWLERHPGTERTKSIYERALRLHINPAFGNRGLNAVALDRDGVERFLRSTLPAKGLGASTVKTCHLILNAVINDAIRSGRLHSKRLSGIKLPPEPRKLHIPFASRRDIAALAHFMPKPYGFTIYLMRGCGLRAGEALGVQRADFTDSRLRISRQMGLDGSLSPLKHREAGDYRDIPLPAYVYSTAPEGWSGYPLTTRGAYQSWFNRARERAGLPKGFTPHTLRHIFASVSLAGGIPITDVSKWLGHQNINITYSIYGHLVPESFDRARGVLDEEWGQ